MTEEIESLKDDNKKLKQQLEFKQIEKLAQNEKYQNPVNEKLLELTHSQISQIETLRHKIMEGEKENRTIVKELDELRNVNMRLKSGTNGEQQWLTQQLERKNKLNKSLKEVIFGVVVQKAGRRDDEDDVEHIMR